MRSTPRFTALAALCLAMLCAAPLRAQTSLPSIAEKTRAMERRDGFLPVYWEAATGKLWMEIPRTGEELIYVVSLPAGMGSNDIGLDRGQLGGERLVRFDRVGPRVLMVQPNQAYRVTTQNPAERRAVEESFAQSVLWGFEVRAETDGRVLVDATDFVLRDAHGVIPALRRARQGDYKLDASRSALYLQNTKAFPRNAPGRGTTSWTRRAAPCTCRTRRRFRATRRSRPRSPSPATTPAGGCAT